MNFFTHARAGGQAHGYGGMSAAAASISAHSHVRHSTHTGRYANAASPSHIGAAASPPAGNLNRMVRHEQPLSKYCLKPPSYLPSLHCDDPDGKRSRMAKVIHSINVHYYDVSFSLSGLLST
jgi:hypothetical protein